jgi:hypothetical protein
MNSDAATVICCTRLASEDLAGKVHPLAHLVNGSRARRREYSGARAASTPVAPDRSTCFRRPSMFRRTVVGSFTRVVVAFRTSATALVLAAAVLAVPAAAQQAGSSPVREGGVYLTIFRSPASGVEVRGGRLGAHAGFYPTILKADGQADGENTNFVRIGGAFYVAPAGWTPYFAPSLLISLDDDWDNALLSELGVRLPVARRAAFRLGVGVLRSFSGAVRVNPTVGVDVRLGRAR